MVNQRCSAIAASKGVAEPAVISRASLRQLLAGEWGRVREVLAEHLLGTGWHRAGRPQAVGVEVLRRCHEADPGPLDGVAVGTQGQRGALVPHHGPVAQGEVGPARARQRRAAQRADVELVLGERAPGWPVGRGDAAVGACRRQRGGLVGADGLPLLTVEELEDRQAEVVGSCGGRREGEHGSDVVADQGSAQGDQRIHLHGPATGSATDLDRLGRPPQGRHPPAIRARAVVAPAIARPVPGEPARAPGLHREARSRWRADRTASQPRATRTNAHQGADPRLTSQGTTNRAASGIRVIPGRSRPAASVSTTRAARPIPATMSRSRPGSGPAGGTVAME